MVQAYELPLVSGCTVEQIFFIYEYTAATVNSHRRAPPAKRLPDLWRTTIWRGQRLMTPCGKRVGSTHPTSTTNKQHANAKLAGYCVAKTQHSYKVKRRAHMPAYGGGTNRKGEIKCAS